MPSNPYAPANRRASSDHYYEDVDPRFASPADLGPQVPSSLAPGQPRQQLAEQSSYEDIQEGARSPAASDISHFTSVSQRGVNPNWRPGPNDMMQLPRRPVQQQQDVLLDSNPDFNIPGAAPRGPIRGRGGGIRGGRLPAPMPSYGVDNGGRYPGGL